MSIEQAAVPPAAAASAPGSGYKHYVLAILTLVYVVNYLDRQILNVLLPLIKKEFLLPDAALGALSGTVFAVVYATLGVPLAIFADRFNRRNIIAGSLAVFSLMTVFCGLASRFWHLVLARFGTGIGESGTGPSINSILTDYYEPRYRATALSFYSAGLNIGLLLGFFGGGWIAQHYGWRDAFLAAGAPGLLLFFVVQFTVREPIRGSAERLADAGTAPPFWSVVERLWSLRSFRWLAVGTGMNAFGGYALVAFLPLFLYTSHHMSPVQIGVTLALLTGIPGAIGTFLSGVLADRIGKREPRAFMFVPMIGVMIAIPFGPIVYLSQSTAIAIAAAVIPAIMGAIYVGPGLAATQSMVPPRMRATAVALFLFILNIIGLGLGPVTVGLVSDLLRPSFGADSLRWALMLTLISGSIAAFCYWRASRTLAQDMSDGAALD
jgi:predicted MFS family arabinose efflux permease